MNCELIITDIELENFRLFDKVKVHFDSQLTLFISENGAGKTALLEGIAKALMVVTERLAHDKKELGKGVYDLTDIKNNTPSTTTRIYLKSKAVVDSVPTIQKISWQLLFNKKETPVKVEKNKNDTYLDTVAEQIDKAIAANEAVSLPVIVYYPCERLFSDSKNGQEEIYGMGIFNGYDHALDGLSLNYKRFLEWYDWQERIERAKKSNPVLDIVKEAIFAILNDDDDNDVFKNIYIDPSQFKNPRLMIQKGKEEVSVNQLSSGEKALMLLVSNLAYRLALLNPFSKDLLKQGQGIVLIDEIDLHLHPRWQRKVIPKLRKIFPSIQFIITTHSPQVLMNVKRENVKVINNGVIEEAPFIEGRDANALSTDVFGLTKRLPVYEKMLDKVYDLIDKGDEKQAEIAIENLKQKWGEADLDLHRAQSFLEIL